MNSLLKWNTSKNFNNLFKKVLQEQKEHYLKKKNLLDNVKTREKLFYQSLF